MHIRAEKALLDVIKHEVYLFVITCYDAHPDWKFFKISEEFLEINKDLNL